MRFALAVSAGLIGSTAAQAVHLDPGDRGQVLLYPYYTVNNHQQTLLSVTNTTEAAQVVKVRFLEGYNGRPVKSFNVWLGPHDVWTATVFALEDAGLAGEGAAIRTADLSCTSPQFAESGVDFGGLPYVPFINDIFNPPIADGGPAGTARTREGWIEIFAMANVTEPLLSALMPTESGEPANCAALRDATYAGAGVTNRPDGGLTGMASIINVGQGTLLATRAEALGGFTGVNLFVPILGVWPTDFQPNLYHVNDTDLGLPATAHLFDANGRVQSLTYGATPDTRPVDAVTAVLMADQVSNEFDASPGLNAGSDWVLTMPTKPFYTDVPFRTSHARQPFEESFHSPGQSAVELSQSFYDREGSPAYYIYCGFSGCAPAPMPPSPKYVVNVLSFSNAVLAASSVLASTLFEYAQPQFHRADGSVVVPLVRLQSETGWMQLNLRGPRQDSSDHFLPPSVEGKVLHGLPVIGFWATNLVNGAVSNGVLSNYGAAVRHTTSVSCVKSSDGTACD